MKKSISVFFAILLFFMNTSAVYANDLKSVFSSEEIRSMVGFAPMTSFSDDWHISQWWKGSAKKTELNKTWKILPFNFTQSVFHANTVDAMQSIVAELLNTLKNSKQ